MMYPFDGSSAKMAMFSYKPIRPLQTPRQAPESTMKHHKMIYSIHTSADDRYKHATKCKVQEKKDMLIDAFTTSVEQ